jgi:hypothetical protein
VAFCLLRKTLSQASFHHGLPGRLGVADVLRGKCLFAVSNTTASNELYAAVAVSARSMGNRASSAAQASHADGETLWKFHLGRKDSRGVVRVIEERRTGK